MFGLILTLKALICRNVRVVLTSTFRWLGSGAGELPPVLGPFDLTPVFWRGSR